LDGRLDRLAEDVVRVIDAAGVNRPVVIGRSFAGEELHVLGACRADKIAGLVYIDAAFNRGDDPDNGAYDAVARTSSIHQQSRKVVEQIAASVLSLTERRLQGSSISSIHAR
jgi:pimeloyl-ACP methyl ester carboxylesterase